MRKTMKSDPARKSTGRAKTKEQMFQEGKKAHIKRAKKTRNILRKKGFWPDK